MAETNRHMEEGLDDIIGTLEQEIGLLMSDQKGDQGHEKPSSSSSTRDPSKSYHTHSDISRSASLETSPIRQQFIDGISLASPELDSSLAFYADAILNGDVSSRLASALASHLLSSATRQLPSAKNSYPFSGSNDPYTQSFSSAYDISSDDYSSSAHNQHPSVPSGSSLSASASVSTAHQPGRTSSLIKTYSLPRSSLSDEVPPLEGSLVHRVNTYESARSSNLHDLLLYDTDDQNSLNHHHHHHQPLSSATTPHKSSHVPQNTFPPLHNPFRLDSPSSSLIASPANYPTEPLQEIVTAGTDPGRSPYQQPPWTPQQHLSSSSIAKVPVGGGGRLPLKSTPTYGSVTTESSFPRVSSSSALMKNFHRKSLSVSSIFSHNSNRNITLAALKKSIHLKPGEGQRSNYVQTIRRSSGTAYNDIGPESWRLPTGILPIDRSQLVSTEKFNRINRVSRGTKASGVGLKHGHLAPRLLAAEVDESAAVNKFGSLGRSSTLSKTDDTSSSSATTTVASPPLPAAANGSSSSGMVSRQSSLVRSGTLASGPSAAKPVELSRHGLVSSRVTVGSLSEDRFNAGYYQHAGFGYDDDEETEVANGSPNGTINHELSDAVDDEKPRLVLANPDRSSSDED